MVDPTDADAVAAALLRILTAPNTWDELSSNGMKHIMVGSGSGVSEVYWHECALVKQAALNRSGGS